MKRAVIFEKNESIVVVGTRVVVAGGTQGIGEGIAYRFAQGGAEVWIIGRNETKAHAVLARLKEISQEKQIPHVLDHRFFKADLSLVAEAVRTAEYIRTHTGSNGVDYLVMCQGGPPNGTYVLTSEGNEQHYAVQVLSRFVLAYKLAVESAPVVTKGVMSIMAPGYRQPVVDYDDLDLRISNQKGAYGILRCLSRDSVVVDTFTEELSRLVPNVAFTHVFPGHVKTNNSRNSAMPWYYAAVAAIYLAIAGDTTSSYAEVPYYLLAHPEGRVATTRTHFWDENAENTKLNPVLQTDIRTKILEHLMGKMKVRRQGERV